MSILYNIIIWLYLVSIHISALFNPKARLWLNGRKNIFKQIEELVKDHENIVWFHCASLGEFEQGRPIIVNYRLKNPKHKILLTFFSPSGFEVRKKNSFVDWVFYLPIDIKSNVKKFISIVKPIKAIFIKYEFWFNYMDQLKKKNIPFYSVSSVFRQNQIFFKYKWFTKQLMNVNHFFVQDQKSKDLLKYIGYHNCTVSGDTRFDSVLDNSKKTITIPIVELFSKNEKTIVIGSSWPKDEKIIIQYIKNHTENNYIIAPHELNKISILQKKTNAILFSNANRKNILNKNVLIIDNIGLLSSIYKYGDIAYIGGGFSKGIHNILEAVAFGLPVIFGPKYQNYNEAISLINKKGAISITNYNELCLAVNSLNKFEKSIALDYIKENIGATKKIVSFISKPN